MTSIGEAAFSACTGLTSIIIPNSVNSIGFNAFANCDNLTSIRVESGNSKYDSRNDCNAIILTSENELVAGCKNTMIPTSVTSIGSGAFYMCSGMTSINIPNSIKNIASMAFYNCASLTSATIPNSVTSIGGYAFENCSGITSVTVGNSVTSIGNGVFHNCTALTSVTIGKSVTSIGSGVFESCKNIENVYCYAEKVPSTATDAFKNAYTEYATLYVPEASINSYKSTTPWSNFGTIKATPKPCAIPTISVVNGKLYFNCETEGAKIHYKLTPSIAETEGDINGGNYMSVPTYTVTCYATADGYLQSETATQEIEYASGGGNADVNADGTVDISDVNKVISVICGNE